MTSGNEKANGKKKPGDLASRSKLAAFGGDAEPGVRVLWDEAAPESVHAVVCAMSRLGGAILFGGSRDQGALLVTLLLDDDRKNVWIGGGENPDEALYEIFQKLSALE